MSLKDKDGSMIHFFSYQQILWKAKSQQGQDPIIIACEANAWYSLFLWAIGLHCEQWIYAK